jgi:hypothetical protein
MKAFACIELIIGMLVLIICISANFINPNPKD